MQALISSHILTIITFTPALGALLILCLKRAQLKSIRAVAVIMAVLSFVFSLHLIAHFDNAQFGFQYAINLAWIPSIGIRYSMGIDASVSF